MGYYLFNELLHRQARRRANFSNIKRNSLCRPFLVVFAFDGCDHLAEVFTMHAFSLGSRQFILFYLLLTSIVALLELVRVDAELTKAAKVIAFACLKLF